MSIKNNNQLIRIHQTTLESLLMQPNIFISNIRLQQWLPQLCDNIQQKESLQNSNLQSGNFEMPPKNKSKHKPTFMTRNPCNEFLIQHLILARGKRGQNARFAPRDRKDHRFFMFTTAIDSIRKYPLPIVCEQQLRMLIGIGDYLAADLINTIRDHYRKFLVHNNFTAHQQAIRNNHQKENHQQGSQSTFKCLSEGIGQTFSDEQQQEKDRMDNFCHNKDLTQSQTNFAFKSNQMKQKTFNYKPRTGSQAANVLRVMRMGNAKQKSMSKKDINNALLLEGNEKIKQWKSIKQQLINNQCISLDQTFDYQSFLLTEKGYCIAGELQEKQVSNTSKQKMLQEVKVFKNKFKKQEESEQSMSFCKSQSSMKKGGFHYGEESNVQNIGKGLRKQKIIVKEGQQLILVIDTRQMKDHSEKGYFQQKLSQKYRIKIQTSALTIGDFAFMYNGKVLDFIIERKKADDLSASIIDGRYKDQKYRLKNCGAANIIYLYEGAPTASSILKQKQLNNALTKTRVVDGFVVYKTKSINQSAKLLAYMYAELAKKIHKSTEQMFTIGALEDFNRRNSKNRLLTIQKVFGMGLKSFPNVGKQTVTNLVRYFKSYRLLYDKLNELDNDDDRVQFLNGLLKGGRTQAGVTKLIVDLLFKGK